MAEKLVRTIYDTMVFAVQTGYLYNREDCWVAIEESTAKVGVSEYVQKSKGPVVFLETIDLGSEVKQDQDIGKIETLKATVHIFSPVAGKVIEINPRLKPKPYLINHDPYGAGWIYRIKLSNFEGDRGNLLQAEDYLAVALVKFSERFAGIQSGVKM